MIKELEFKLIFNYMEESIHLLSREKGWWDNVGNDGEKIALIHSELSEALEALREDKQSDKIPKFLGVEEELADAIIRIMDLAHARSWDVAGAIVAKHEYNSTRAYKHGGKKF